MTHGVLLASGTVSENSVLFKQTIKISLSLDDWTFRNRKCRTELVRRHCEL